MSRKTASAKIFKLKPKGTINVVHQPPCHRMKTDMGQVKSIARKRVTLFPTSQ